ncbi:Hypothetical predicted protein [Octopus vulgaris]|uniref:Uncharacterized protein n=1 Tax=Octopus vulgaris TaxID=6645 RepID=A0AA36AXK1_OCTVU|nr:Hypothetical predicted protein [Octopus vulgaris]
MYGSIRILTTDEKLTRFKRQVADMRVAEYRALMALSRKITCTQVACGLVDIDKRSKRQTGDVKIAEYQAWLGLSGTVPPGCVEVACGVVDINASGKRTSSDQRIAELRALKAMSKVAGHGQYDFAEIAPCKRTPYQHSMAMYSISYRDAMYILSKRI